MDIKKVLVVGSGLMGSGIAQVCAQAGIDVSLNDVSAEALARARKRITWSLGKLVEKGKLQETVDTILSRINPVTRLDVAEGVHLAIEAVFEKIELKHEVFKILDRICPPETLIASNTSAIPITELAAVSHRPQQVLGLHFFSPVPILQVCR